MCDEHEFPIEDKFKLMGAACSKYGVSLRKLERFIDFGTTAEPPRKKYPIAPPGPGTAPLIPPRQPEATVQKGTGVQKYEFIYHSRTVAAGTAAECAKNLGLKNKHSVYAMAADIKRGKRPGWAVKKEIEK